MFNGLNTVASLIPDNPREAENAVLDLAALLRYTLESSRKQMVTLGEELDAVGRYLAFEKRRFGSRLRVETKVDSRLRTLAVPPLVLQPLVENAVNHGISNRREGGLVRIEATEEGEHLVLRIDDDGPGPDGSLRCGSRTASADLNQRLELYYGGCASLTTGRSPLDGFRAEVIIPIADGRQVTA